MVLAGVVAGSALALGTQIYRAQQPRKNLAATLRPDGVERATVPQLISRSAVSRTIAVGGLAMGGSLFLLASASGLTPWALVTGLVTVLRANRYGPLLYIAVGTLRPLIFIPASLMTIASGLLYGPLWGTVYALSSASTSAMTAYLVGKNLLPKATAEQGSRPLVARYGNRMRQKPFESMVLMHSLLLPFDPLNGLAGYLQLDWKPFLVGTILGTIPGTVTYTLFGASLEGTTIRGLPRFNPAMLVASGVILAGSLSVAYLLRKCEGSAIDMPIPV